MTDRPSTKHLLDPELHPLLDLLPFDDLGPDNLADVRAFRNMVELDPDPERSGVARTEVRVSGDDHDVRCLLYRPLEPTGDHPGYLHIHGGGYVMGNPESADAWNIGICSALGAVVLSVAYRLAPEHPAPAALDDCCVALRWLHANAGELGVDPTRIAVGGESAGGGLAAAVAIRARDEDGPPLCHQHLTYPMLDDRTGSGEHPGDPLVGEFIWTRASNQFGWRSYLGDGEPAAPQVPARLDDVRRLPDAWIWTGGLDLFRDEDIAYARSLMTAGVPVELVVYPAVCHGFQWQPGTRALRDFERNKMAALARGLGVRRRGVQG